MEVSVNENSAMLRYAALWCVMLRYVALSAILNAT